MLPGDGSKLIDAIDTVTVYEALDQRGVSRPQGPRADIGAVEVEAPVENDVVTLDKNITVTEAEDAIITALRTGQAVGAASVTLTAVDGTAVFETDYSLQSGTVEFPAAADAAAQQTTLAFPTVARAGKQGDRIFTVTLSVPSEGAELGEPQTVTVTIVDKGEQAPGPDPDPDPDPTPTAPAGDNDLSVTGGELNGWLIGGTLLTVLLGAALLTRQWIAARR
ncbi:hypothetical protein ACI1US_00075 [Leucobacter sp. BZR 635]